MKVLCMMILILLVVEVKAWAGDVSRAEVARAAEAAKHETYEEVYHFEEIREYLEDRGCAITEILFECRPVRHAPPERDDLSNLVERLNLGACRVKKIIVHCVNGWEGIGDR